MHTYLGNACNTDDTLTYDEMKDPCMKQFPGQKTLLSPNHETVSREPV